MNPTKILLAGTLMVMLLATAYAANPANAQEIKEIKKLGGEKTKDPTKWLDGGAKPKDVIKKAEKWAKEKHKHKHFG